MYKRGKILSFLVVLILLSMVSADLSDSGFLSRKNITIPSGMISQNLNDFPLLINIYDSDMKNLTKDDGSDIIFSSDGSNILSYQIESFNKTFNSTDAELIAWVRINLSSSSNNILWIYFNNVNATKLVNSTDTWTNDFKGVYHMKEETGNVIDSTRFSYNSSSVGGTPDYLQTGKIGKSINFLATSDENFNFGDVNDFDFEGDFSVSAWIKTTQSAASIGICGKLNNAATPYKGFTMQTNNGYGTMWLNGLQNITTTSVNDNNWHLIQMVRNQSGAFLFIDAILRGYLNNYTTTANSNSFYIGAWGYNMGLSYDYSGLIDEIQISNSSWSFSWINATYQNQNNPMRFYTIGKLQTLNSSSVVFSNFITNPESYSIYNSTLSYIFNATITESNGTGILEFNGVNYSSSNNSNIFSSIINNLAAGSYSYKWISFSSSSIPILSTSSEQSYVINKTYSSISLLVNGTSSDIVIPLGTSINLNCSINNGEGIINLYKNGALINSGRTTIGNYSNFSSIGLFIINCSYPGTQNYSSSSVSYNINVGNVTNQPLNLEYIYPTPEPGTITPNTSVEIFYKILTNNLTQSFFNWDTYNHRFYDNNLLLFMNFDNNINLGENLTNFIDISPNKNNGSCSANSCPNFTNYGGRFSYLNPNNNNLFFSDRFNNDLSNWTINQYGGSVSIVTKDYSNKLLLNDTSSASYVSGIINFTNDNSKFILEYDTMYLANSIGIVELLDENNNAIVTISTGVITNTISFDSDSEEPSTAVFNSGGYKQIILSVDPLLSKINAYLSESDGTYGSLVQIGNSKNYSGAIIKKINFRTDTLGTGVVYFDEVRLYKPVLAIIGDSITDGKPRWSTHPDYPTGRLTSNSNETSMPNYKIQERLCKNCWVANRAFGGTTISGVNNHIQTSILDQGFSQVYISIGHNDIMNGVNIATMQTNFNSIIDKVFADGITGENIYIANVFPSGYLDDTQQEIDTRNQWNSWLKNKTLEIGAIYVDLDSALMDPLNNNSIKPGLSDDGTHLYPAGNDILSETVVSSIYNATEVHGYGSLNFDGNDKIIINNNSQSYNNELTILAYVKFSIDNNNSKIISKGQSFSLGIINNRFILKLKASGSTSILTSNFSYNDDKWHNIAGIYNGSILSLYIDGELQGVNLSSSGLINSTSEYITIGSNSSSEYFKGSIDELMIYNKSMNNLEINFIKNLEFRKINSSYWKAYILQENLTQKTYEYFSSSLNIYGFSNNPETRNITVIYDSLPPGRVRNLNNITNEITSIYWTWINPIDIDFEESLVYLNGVNIINTSLNYYQASSLTANTNYNLTLYTKDLNGNINKTGVSSLSRTKDNPYIPPSNPPAAGGGSSGGGGGGILLQKVNLTSVIKLDVNKLKNIIARSGVKKTLSIVAKNTGNIFLNKCKLVVKGDVSTWIYAKQVEGISPGENINFVFDLNVPEEVSLGEYSGNLQIVCSETIIEQDLLITVPGNLQSIKIIEVEHLKERLLISYSLNSSDVDKETSVEIWLVDKDKKEIKRMQDKFEVASVGITERSVNLEIPEDLVGVFYIYFALTSNKEDFVRQSVVLGKPSTTGMAILENPSNKKFLYILFLIIVLSGIFFVFLNNKKSKMCDDLIMLNKQLPLKKLPPHIKMKEETIFSNETKA